MAKVEDIKIKVQHTKYVLVIIPFATYTKVGHIAILKVFGIPVFKKCGESWSLFGVVNHAS